MDRTPFAVLQRDATGYQRSCALTAAAELDFFTVILRNGNRMNAGDLARECGVDERGAAVLLNALAGMGYLCKSIGGASADPDQGGPGVYAVAEAYRDALDSRHPLSYVPMLRHMANAQRGWAELARTVRDGKPRTRRPSILGEEEDDRSFIMGMNSLAVRTAGPMIRALHEAGVLHFGEGPARILDVGGASGTYTQAFLECLPTATAVIFDRPVGIEAAQQRFAGTPLEGRVDFQAGDFYSDALPSGFDLAWISAIIHQHGREQSRALYRNALQALKSGGKVAVRDFIMSADGTSPAAGALFGLNMLVHCGDGRVYTFEEVREDLQAAGFTAAELAVPAETMSAVVTAVRPRM